MAKQQHIPGYVSVERLREEANRCSDESASAKRGGRMGEMYTWNRAWHLLYGLIDEAGEERKEKPQ